MSVPALAVAALASWLLTVSLGGLMLGTWLASGGLRRRRATGAGPPPGVIFGHMGLALSGLGVWAGYLAAPARALAWVAVGLLTLVIGLGISTVTLWTPYPVAGPPGDSAAGAAASGAVIQGVLATPAADALSRRVTDDMLARALSDPELASQLADMVVVASTGTRPPPAHRRNRHLTPLIPAGHGLLAVTTFLLVVLAAVGTG